MKSIIVIKNLNKSFGPHHILKNVSFTVPEGAFVIFAGKNGSGKTTTIKSILDLYSPDKGSSITINNVDSKNPDARQYIAYVPEKDNFSNEKVKNFLIRMGLLNNIPVNQLETKIWEYVKLFDVEKYLNTRLDHLSSGNTKKIMLIQALLSNANCFIMDEPTDNLDPETRAIFYKLMKKLQKEKKTIFISSHNLLEVGEYANYAIIIADGEIKYTGKFKNSKALLKLYGI